MSPEGIRALILRDFSDTQAHESWGETSLFCNPGGRFARGAYFLTLKSKDGANDRASALDRPGVFRMSFGLPRGVFEPLFGRPPARPGKGGVIEGPWDFTAEGQLMPHPVYGWMSWVCILNPSAADIAEHMPLIRAAHAKAVKTFERRARSK
jgi:hypothetical protein